MTNTNLDINDIGRTLQEQCVLFSLRMSLPTQSVTLRTVSEDINKQHSSTSARAIGEVMHNELKRACGRIRTSMARLLSQNSIVYGQGQRLVAPVSIAMLKEAYDKHQAEFTTLVDGYLEDWPAYVDTVRRQMGDLYTPETLPPTPDQYREQFKLTLVIDPVPSGDFMFTNDNKDLQELVRDTLSISYSNSIEQLETAAIRQIRPLLAELSERCEAFTKAVADGSRDGTHAVLRSSAVEQLQTSKMLAEGYNFTGNKTTEIVATVIGRVLDATTNKKGMVDGKYAGTVKGALDKLIAMIDAALGAGGPA